MTTVKTELAKLVEDVYQQGYMCGLDRAGTWFQAYAAAAERIMQTGCEFSDQLLDECKKEGEL